jgi:hypothetical protein
MPEKIFQHWHFFIVNFLSPASAFRHQGSVQYRLSRISLALLSHDYITPLQTFFTIIPYGVSKNAKFDADVKSVEKTGKIVTEKKLWDLEFLPTVLKDEK